MKKAKAGPTAAELSTFCSQVAMILDSGLVLYDGMETLADTYRDHPSADLYLSASRRVTETGSLYEALKADDRWPGYLVEMTGVGERSGHLEDVMRGLAGYYQREDRIRNAVHSAVTYPLTLCAILVAVVLIMLWKVLPVFRRVLGGMGIGVNGTGAAMMRLGTVLGWAVLALVALAVIAVLLVTMLLKTGHAEKVRVFLGRLFPPYRKLKRQMSASRVASVLSLMLSGGFDLNEALRMTGMVLSEQDAADRINAIRARLGEGGSFSEALEKSGLFETLHSRMVRMGIAAGREDTVMAQLAGIYEDQVETGISSLIGVIEPTLVAVLCVVIGAILLSVMLPMAGILTSMF